MSEENKEEILKRALYYQSQYRNALLANAISFYDANLTKDTIESEIMYKDIKGEFHSSLERIGMKFPCKFSEFINQWIKKMVPKEYVERYPHFNYVREYLINLYNEGQREYNVDYWVETRDGLNRYINQCFVMTMDENGDILALSIVKDHTKEKIIEEDIHKKELEQYAYYDPITHGYNYIKFKDMIKVRGTPGSIISFDTHSFKIINSICGILKGDEVICEIWKLICEIFDFDQGDFAAHINADHFIIFVPGFDAQAIIRKIKNLTLALTILSSELSVPQIKPYYGISKWSSEKKIELSYSEAVAAKGNAKDSQSENYAFFNEDDTKRLIEEKTIIDDFDNALAKKEFKIWYQPKFEPASGKLVGAEALVRWIKDDGTIVSPGDFIPVFEKNGLIRQFDEYIFRNVCKQQKRWQKQNKLLVPISINLSRISLYYKNIVNTYKKISEEIGVEKDIIPIEITETATVVNKEMKEIADSFFAAGFTLYMDDFGSGYSSLATLNQLHFDTLKIDKGLVDYIGNFGGDRLLEHTILLAKELGMHVTAEGVETERQVAFLKHVGCDSIQGFFYSKPLDREKFEELLDAKNVFSGNTENEQVIEHIMNFKKSIGRYPIYSFLINLSKNSFVEENDSTIWHKETGSTAKSYSESKKDVAERLIHPDFKEAFLKFMNRERLIESYSGRPETRIFEYVRLYNGKYTPMRTMYHIFKVENSDDLYAFQTISIQ